MAVAYKLSRTNSHGRFKSNCSNTLDKFVVPEVERVTKLNFYSPDNVNLLDSLYKSRNQAKSMAQMNSVQFLKHSQFRSTLSSMLLVANEQSEPERKKKCFKSADRIENMAYETELESRRNKVETKIQSKNNEKEQIIKELQEIDSNLSEIRMKIQVLDNFDHYYDMNERFKKTFEKEVQDKKLKKSDSDRYLRLRSNFKTISNNREEENNKLKVQSTSLLNEKENSLNLLRKIKEKKAKYKHQLQGIKNELIVHYHSLLSDGLDTRYEGLSWIIKAIWNLGSNVLLSFLPKYLDEECILYLFKYSKRDRDAKKISDQIQELKEKLKIDKIEQNLRDQKSIQIRDNKKNEDLKKSKKKKEEFKRSDIILHPQSTLMEEDKKSSQRITFKKLNHYDSTSNFKFDDESLKYIHKIRELENQLQEIKNELNILKHAELVRINKEFLLNDYERRFNVNQKTLISAIIGEDNAGKELLKQIRDQKNYFKSIKCCKTFNFLEDAWKKKKELNHNNEMNWN